MTNLAASRTFSLQISESIKRTYENGILDLGSGNGGRRANRRRSLAERGWRSHRRDRSSHQFSTSPTSITIPLQSSQFFHQFLSRHVADVFSGGWCCSSFHGGNTRVDFAAFLHVCINDVRICYSLYPSLCSPICSTIHPSDSKDAISCI